MIKKRPKQKITVKRRAETSLGKAVAISIAKNAVKKAMELGKSRTLNKRALEQRTSKHRPDGKKKKR